MLGRQRGLGDVETAEHLTLPLWDYGWLDATRYVWPADMWSPAAALSELLRDPVFARSFAAPRAQDASPGIHGPFLIDRLSEREYAPVSFDDVREAIAERLVDGSFEQEPSPEQRAGVERLLVALAPQPLKWRKLTVRPGDPERRHEAWFVHRFFDEYVGCGQGATWLLVVGYD